MMERDNPVSIDQIEAYEKAGDELAEDQPDYDGLDPWVSPKFLAEGYLEGSGGKYVTAAKLMEVIGGDVTLALCDLLLRGSDLTQTIRVKGEETLFLSLAPPLEPTPEGLLYEAEQAKKHDKLGREAIEDYKKLVDDRSPSHWRKNRRVRTYY
jgi:hypothetical protein